MTMTSFDEEYILEQKAQNDKMYNIGKNTSVNL